MAFAERQEPSAPPRDPFHDERIVGIGDEQRLARAALQNLGLGVGDGLARAKEPDVRVSDIGPHADVRLGNFDEPSDFSRVIHAQFDHGDVKAGRQAGP